MRNSFEVEILDKGMNVTVFEDKGEEIYESPMKIAESSKDKIKEYFNKWIDSNGSGFDFGSTQE